MYSGDLGSFRHSHGLFLASKLYTLVNANRRLTTHGGLIIYIHNDFEFKELNREVPITHAYI